MVKAKKRHLISYVDDLILITETSDEMWSIKKKCLSDTFKIKDMGNLQYCLGITFIQTKDSLSMSQKQYIVKLVEKYGLSEAKTVATPMDVNVK